MHEVKLTFTDGKYILLKPGDTVIPYGINRINPLSPDIKEPVVLDNNSHDEFITDILGILCQYDFFFVNNLQKAYNTKFVIRVKGF